MPGFLGPFNHSLVFKFDNFMKDVSEVRNLSFSPLKLTDESVGNDEINRNSSNPALESQIL